MMCRGCTGSNQFVLKLNESKFENRKSFFVEYIVQANLNSYMENIIYQQNYYINIALLSGSLRRYNIFWYLFGLYPRKTQYVNMT